MNFLSRDLLTLDFNRRVAEEGVRSRNNTGTKVQFFGIAISNIREFMQVRYPSILEESEDDQYPKEIMSGALHAYKDTCKLFKEFNQKRRLVRKVKNLPKKEYRWCAEYFHSNIFPTLLPITVDKARQPNIHNGLYILVTTRYKDDEDIGYVEIPTGLPRFIRVPKRNYVIAIEDLITEHLKDIFRERKIVSSVPFAINRSAEIYIAADQYSDPFKLIQDTLKEREESWITLLELGSFSYMKKIRKFLSLDKNTLIVVNDLIRLSDLRDMPEEVYKDNEKPKTYRPYQTMGAGVFDQIKRSDILLLHPFESYDESVVRFIEEAAEDPDVVSIRICLYRVSTRSRIIDALIKAADSGKLITALIELKARFDEKHNLQLARIMREGGVRIIYTKPDIKTHAKLCLVTRNEKKGMRIYSHVATGNYSESNSRVYVDYSYFTADPQIGMDLTKFFNLLTSDQGNFKSKRILYAPYNLKSEIVKEIDRQVERAKSKKSAQITIKCNALTDIGVAERLVDAAKAGVNIRLIVRSACIIKPMKNIQVYSIVGAFLEHSRVYVFGTGRQSTVYIGSADMMTRNLSRRNELLLKVTEKDLKKRLLKHIEWYLKDTENRWAMLNNYTSKRVRDRKKKSVDVHQLFRKEAKEIAHG